MVEASGADGGGSGGSVVSSSAALEENVESEGEALAGLERRGFHVIRKRLEPKRLQELREAFDARVDCSVGGEVDLGCNWTEQTVTPFLRVLLDESLIRLLARVCGLPFVALRLELFGKGPRSETAIPWHQDTFTTHTGFRWTAERAAAGTSAAPHPVTLWVALDDTSLENGGMEMIPGRHLELLNGSNGAVPEEAIATDERVDYRMAAGQAGLHHPLVPHRSVANTSSRQRRAFLVRCSPWTESVETQCGTLADVRGRVRASGWPQWSSEPRGEFAWLPGNGKAIGQERALNRLLVCCAAAAADGCPCELAGSDA